MVFGAHINRPALVQLLQAEYDYTRSLAEDYPHIILKSSNPKNERWMDGWVDGWVDG